MTITNQDWIKYFPHKKPRQSQIDAINFTLQEFNLGKKFVVLEAGTGVGKSAIGITIARYLKANDSSSDGSYVLTTQKILQEQYTKDFGGFIGPMRSIKSSSNYTCNFNRKTSCGESLRALRTAEKKSKFWKACTFNCVYRKAKEEFINSDESITNFSYFLAESAYAGKIKPRNFLIIDEAHNAEIELSKFIEMTITERFANSGLKINFPDTLTANSCIGWIKTDYLPKAKKNLKHFETTMEKYIGLKDKIQSGEFAGIAKKFDMLDKHICKLNRFLKLYNKDNWVFNLHEADGKKSRKMEFKPVDVAPYAYEMLHKFGGRVLLMSATILDKISFCRLLGIDNTNAGFISINSPFPVDHRPIIYSGIGKMSASHINNTLPKLAEAVRAIMTAHPNEKGIIHCHSYKIAHYLKKNIRSRRIIFHDSTNREKMLAKHLKSKVPTVLLSPSMTEGVDLKGDLSRFQIVCKIPYPYLGDKLIRKKMNKWKWWYSLQTTKTIVQAVGRSVRSMDDKAVTYILDSDWSRFYSQNKKYFPVSFKEALQ